MKPQTNGTTGPPGAWDYDPLPDVNDNGWNIPGIAKSTRFSSLQKTIFSALKPRPNDCNMATQHVATLLGAGCYVCLGAVLWCVATCWVLLAQIWPFSNLSQQHPTCHNTSQHGGQMHATCYSQQCCDTLHWHVVIVWSGLKIWKVLES